MVFNKSLLLSIILIGTSFVAHAQKAIPNDPVFIRKYAGTYHMAAIGSSISNENDKYVLDENGHGTWTIFGSKKPDGTTSSEPMIIRGTWRAAEGVIQICFKVRKHARVVPQTFRLNGDVFISDKAYLKLMIISPPVQREQVIKK